MPRKATLLVVVFAIFTFNACISAPGNRTGTHSNSRAGGSRQSAEEVKPGEWISKDLYKNSANWFSFTPDSAGILVAETQGDTDTILDLYRGGDLLRENDDVGNDRNAKIEYFVDPGVSYLIRASGVRLAGAEENASGPYRFRVILEPMPAKKAQPNDTLEWAEALALGETVTDHFFTAEDVNWYSVSTPGAGRLTINTEGTLDTLLEVYDKWGELIGRDDDSGYQGNAKVVTNLFSASPVYFRVNAYQGATGRYYVKTKFAPPVKPDPFENDNAIPDAKDIQIGVPQERNFTDAGDIDWARLRIDRQDNYRIAATAADNYLDTFIQLFDAAENLLAEDDDSGGFWNALLIADLKPGTYYIRVSCVDRDPLERSEYTLAVFAEN